MHVRQLSISYLPEQDRILVRVNTSDNHELQFWFTRRLTLGLVPLFERIVTEHAAAASGPADTRVAASDPIARKAIAEFARAETMRTADFSTPYRTPETSQPLFASPLLVTDITLTPLAGAQMRMRCAEKLADHPQARQFELALSQQLTHAFMHLLERALRASQWRQIDVAQRTDTASGPPVAPPAAKPDYLN
jgi:hypothetical protein